MTDIAVIGGGLAGLTAAITCAEGGASVRLFEANSSLGGRARSIDGPYKANLGPHAIYSGGVMWDWLTARGLVPPLAGRCSLACVSTTTGRSTAPRRSA